MTEKTELDRTERLLKYWPLIAAAALILVSVFNIGYFMILGMHFIGVMDISNIVYSVGLIFALLIVPIIMFPAGIIDTLRDVAHSQDLARKLEKWGKWITGFLFVSFAISLFVHRPFISIIGLFAIYFVAACLAYAAYAYIIFENTGTLSTRIIVSGFSFFPLYARLGRLSRGIS